MNELKKEALEDFQRTVEAASELLLSMTEAESETRRTPDKWSTKEIIGHLIDSAANNHARFVAAQFKDDLIFPGYAQEEWVSTQHYQQSSWPLLINLWKSYNLHLLHVVSSISEEKLKQPCRQHTLHKIAFVLLDESEPATLEYLVLDYIVHLKHHLRQILGREVI